MCACVYAFVRVLMPLLICVAAKDRGSPYPHHKREDAISSHRRHLAADRWFIDLGLYFVNL